MSAPFSRSCTPISKWPSLQARWNGVQPFLVWHSTFAFLKGWKEDKKISWDFWEKPLKTTCMIVTCISTSVQNVYNEQKNPCKWSILFWIQCQILSSATGSLSLTSCATQDFTSFTGFENDWNYFTKHGLICWTQNWPLIHILQGHMYRC